MFYSQFILAKKGPLGTIWIAAHLERKLRKNQVTETNIGVSVDSILFPEVPIALRLSGHLLLGVVRIYSRKVNYLFHDCSEALVKIKQAFHAGAVDLPPEAATAPFHSITLPETFDLDEFEPLLDKELNLLHSNGAVDHHVSSREQITLQDPLEDSTYLGSAQFELDERFPDADAPRLGMDFDEDLLDKPTREASPAMDTLEEDVTPPSTMGDALDYDQMDRMEPMDVDEQNEPVTPGLGVDMDLDYQRENDELEGDLQRDPDELERLEPNLQIDNDELDNLQVEGEQLASLEPVTPGLAPEKDEGERPLDEEAVEGTPEQQEEREELAADINKPEDEEMAGKPTEEEAVSGQPEKETLQGQVGGETSMLEEENLQGLAEEPGLELKAAEEGTAGGRQETELEEQEKLSEGEKVGIDHEKGNDEEEVPEYEKVMSAPEAGSQDPDVFDLDNSVNLEQGAAPSYQASSYQDRNEFPELEKDSNLRLDDETLPVIPEEDPESAMADKMSPLRSPPFPAISSSDLPGDDDVLATLLGRGTPAITVQPTPVETTVTKPRRKQGQRKRKTVMDMMTILGADVMKQQLMNTDDIRRVRRKAPCTRQDLWNVQKDALGQQIFCEQSVPGLCGEIRSLFERVYVVGEANLPLAEDFAVDAAAGEQMIEPPLATLADDMNFDVNRMDPQAAEVAAEGGDIQDVADVHRHDEGVEGLDENVSRSPRSPHAAEGVPDEGVQSVPSPTAVAAVQEEEGPQSSPKGNEEPVEAAPVMDLNSESLEMAEATDKDTSKHDDVALVDVNKENPRTDEGDAEVVHGEAVVPPADVVTGPESQDFQVEVPSELEAEAEDTIAPAVILDAEFAARVAEAEAVVGNESDIERGLELHPEFQSGTEAGNEAENEAVDKAGADAEVVRADVHAEEAVVLEALPEGGIGDIEGQDPGQAVIVPEKEAEVEEVEGRTAADMEVDAPQVQSPPVEELGFVETRDTEFLGADDDDLDEEAEDFQDVNEYARREAAAHDNSGWSARTRAVGHYLRITLEDKDAYMKKRKEEGTAKLGLERMLVGKSRKEAARMFFETLVLKTKDYIHVEQDAPYGDIQISARPKLLKAKF